MTMQDHAASTVNVTGTNGKIDTSLTHPSSRTVLEQTRRDLIVTRADLGAETDAGYGCSNLVELVQVLPGYVRPAWCVGYMLSVPWQIERQNNRLQRLLAVVPNGDGDAAAS